MIDNIHVLKTCLELYQTLQAFSQRNEDHYAIVHSGAQREHLFQILIRLDRPYGVNVNIVLADYKVFSHDHRMTVGACACIKNFTQAPAQSFELCSPTGYK